MGVSSGSMAARCCPRCAETCNQMSKTSLLASVLAQGVASISARTEGQQWQRALQGAVLDARRLPAARCHDLYSTACINASARSQQWQQALEVLSLMHGDCPQPDVITYTAGISACARGQHLQQGLEVML